MMRSGLPEIGEMEEMMFRNKTKQELDSILNDLQMNLANNYKDLAHDALKRLHARLETCRQEGSLKEKDYLKYRKIADDYTVRLADYHH